MIKLTNIPSPSERLDVILDKIYKKGVESLNNSERKFLQSYSTGEEEKINKILFEDENKDKFISDDGNFSFKLKYIEQIDDIGYINGELTVPDLNIDKRKVKGKLKGSIIVFSGNNIAIDFRKGKYDVFEFVNGLEQELDYFIDDLILKILG